MKCITLKPSYQTEIYISQGGYFCIKQEDLGGLPQLVMLAPDQVSILAKLIPDLLLDMEEHIALDDKGE